jgi:hypothetical protein
LIATIPEVVAAFTMRLYPKLRTAALPFATPSGGGAELLWPSATDDDAACKFVRERLAVVANSLSRSLRKKPHR